MLITHSGAQIVEGNECKLEIDRREQAYPGGEEKIDLHEKIVILVEDSLETCTSMSAAVETVIDQLPKKTIATVTVSVTEKFADIKARINQAICLTKPGNFGGVGAWYHIFPQIRDDQVRQLLNLAKEPDLRR